MDAWFKILVWFELQGKLLDCFKFESICEFLFINKSNWIHGQKSSQFIKNILSIVDGVQQRAFRHPLWHSKRFFQWKKVLFNSNLNVWVSDLPNALYKTFKMECRLHYIVLIIVPLHAYCLSVNRSSLYLRKNKWYKTHKAYGMLHISSCIR